MTRPVLARRSAIGLGVVYVLLGVMETVRLVVTGDGGLLFWFGTLVGGGALVLVGAVPRAQPLSSPRLLAVLVGACVGIPATAWTVVVPVLAMTVMALTLSSAPESG